MYKDIEIFAEVKTASPFGFESPYSWEELFRVADKIGDVISIHTDARWGGSFDLIQKAKLLTKKPILAKGIHARDEEVLRAIELGADYVLVVGRMPAVHLDKCLIEPHTLDELSQLPLGTKAVWNSRDLNTGGLKEETFEQARELWDGWLCQASNITTVADITPGADAVLVGSCLPEFAKSLTMKG